MKLTLSNVLELADMTKGNFDARRARKVLRFFPLEAVSEAASPSRARYTLADAVALDLFERVNGHARLDNELIAALISNNANFIIDSVSGAGKLRHGYGQPDRYIGVALFDPEGRWHFAGGTLAEIEARIPKSLNPDGFKDDVSEIILLNLSAAHRRVLSRLGPFFQNGSDAK
jgi:hypothetical protein